MSIENLSEIIFKHPFACLVSGPSRAGKSTLVLNIIKQHETLIDKHIDKIVYCYTRYQNVFDNLKETVPDIIFNEGLPDTSLFSSDENNLLILDDLMHEVGSDVTAYNMFCIDSHHKSISIFFMTQNLFPKEKYSRTISLNCNYIILMNNHRDKIQIRHLARQVYPENSLFMIEVYNDAVEKIRFGYLVIDLCQTTDIKHRLQTGILSNETRIVYIPNKII